MKAQAAGNSPLDRLKGGLVVSCQALEDEALHGSSVMVLMARAAWHGGAVGIRANSREDIRAIRAAVPLPIIGLVKRRYPDSAVVITPTLREAQEAVEGGAHLLALDATQRRRPSDLTLEVLVEGIRARWPLPLVADVSTTAEAVAAAQLRFDGVATTLVGYVDGSPPAPDAPDFAVLQDMVDAVTGRFGVPVLAEGRIWEPAQARRCLELGAFAVVVGSAITRPHLITQRFVAALTR